MKDTAALLRSYHNDGSQAAFAEIVAQHIDVIYCVALRKTGDPALAEEATQLVFTDLARKASALSAHPALNGWLFKSAHFAAANLLRAERRHRHHVQQSHTMQPQLHDTPPPSVDWDALRPVLDDAINELGEPEREAVVLRFFHGVDFAALGTLLNLSADGARSRVERAVDKLHAALTRRGITSTSSALAIALRSHVAAGAPAGLAGAIAPAALASAITAAGASGVMTWFKAPVALAALALITATGIYFSIRRSDPRGTEREIAVSTISSTSTTAKASVPVSSPALSPSPTFKTPANEAPITDPELVAGEAFLAKNPKLREILARSQRASWAGCYFPVYLELGLDEATVARLEEILASNGATNRFPAGSSTADSPAMKLRAFALIEKAEREQQLRDLLGEEGYRRFKSHPMFGTDQAMKVAAALSSTDTPLTADQGRKLARIFETTSIASQRSADLWPRLMAEAQTTLSPAQMFPLEALRASDELSQARRTWAQKENALSPDSSRPPVSLSTQLAQDANIPEIQLLSLAVKRAQFAEDYGPLLRQRGLSPEVTTRLTEAFIDREALGADLEAIARARQLARPEVSAVRQGGENQFGALVTELLGAAGPAEWREYERALPARRYVQQLAGVAALSGIAFSAAQVEQLTVAITQANPSYARGGKMDWGRQDWATADARAQKILSPVQFRLVQNTDPARRRWSLNLIREITAAGRPAATPAR